jgi:hypothetical protein
MRSWLALLVVTACSFSSPVVNDVDAPTGGTQSDAPVSVPLQITISGHAIEQMQGSLVSVAGVAVAAFAVTDEQTPLANATTDAQGNYALAIETHGLAFDGYLRATKSGVVDTYIYPPAPISSDFSNATASLIATSDFSGLQMAEGASPGTGTILVVVVDASGTNPVRGATASTTPSSSIVTYMDDNGLPFANGATNSDGRAFIFDVPSGSVTVNATKSGMTFATHALKARADQVTTTLIQAR